MQHTIYTSTKNINNHKDEIELSEVLVVLICIGNYENVDGYQSLPGTETDRNRMYKLFKEGYNYKVIQTKDETVTWNDMDDILIKAMKEFRDPQATNY